MKKIIFNNLTKLFLPLGISLTIIFAYSFIEFRENKSVTEKYTLDKDWPNLPDGFILGKLRELE
jgi:hypothetical protein